jgi:hypothetical protein
VNNYQATTFKSSLAGAAFISSRGEVYRLFQDADDPTLGNDFLLSEIEANEFELREIYDENKLTQPENNSEVDDVIEPEFESENESKIESENESENVVESDNIFCNENYERAGNSSDQILDQLFNQSMQDDGFEIGTLVESGKVAEMPDKLSENFTDNLADKLTGSELAERTNSERRFRIIRNDCESAVAELLALETPKPIINVPEHIPPQDIPFDEKIRRSRAVTGICGKYQPTVQEKIIGKTEAGFDNVIKLRFSVTKNPPPKSSVSNCPAVSQTRPQTKPTSDRARSEIKLSFCPVRDKTVFELDKIVRGNLAPVLDSAPEFFNSVPATIPFVRNQKIDRKNQNKNCPNLKIANSEDNDRESEQNIVTINNDNCIGNDNNKCNEKYNTGENNRKNENKKENNNENGNSNIDDNDNDEVGRILRFPVVVSGVGVRSDVKLFRRCLSGYEFPDEISTFIVKASERVYDLGDRFIDFMRAGKQTISVNGCFAGDGCSLVSVFAAAELASRGNRVLLVDANCRNPALAELLGVGDVANREIITLKSNFDFATVFDKKITANSKLIFRNNKKGGGIGVGDQIGIDDKLCRFIGGLGGEYDLILFDAGCVADVPFNNCVGNWRIMNVDGIFMVVCKKNMQSVNFNHITKKLTDQKIELLGIMVCKD